jgi:hypothetical protein
MLGVERIVSNKLNANPQANSSSSSNAGERPKARANKCVMMLLPHSFNTQWNAAQGSQSGNSQLSRDRAEHSRNKAGEKGLILRWQQKLSHSQTKTLSTTLQSLKKQVMKGQPSSCNSQPTCVKFEIPEHDRSWAGKKKIKSTAASRYCYNSHFHEFWWITWFSFFFNNNFNLIHTHTLVCFRRNHF